MAEFTKKEFDTLIRVLDAAVHVTDTFTVQKKVRYPKLYSFFHFETDSITLSKESDRECFS